MASNLRSLWFTPLLPTGGSHSLPSSSNDISGWASRSSAISPSSGGRLSRPWAASTRSIACACLEAAATARCTLALSQLTARLALLRSSLRI